MEKQILKKFKWSGIIREKLGKFKLPKLPSNYRKIPEKIVKKTKYYFRSKQILILVGITSLVLLILIVISGINLYKNIQEKERIESQRRALVLEVDFWEKVVRQHQGYRDAYFQLALLEYQLKDFEKSASYLQQVLLLDPNFEPAKELGLLIDANSK